MNLNDNLQSYLAGNASHSKRGMFGFLRSSQSTHPDTQNLLNTPGDNQRKGLFSSIFSSLPSSQSPETLLQEPQAKSRWSLPTLGYYQRFAAFALCLITGGIFLFAAMMNVPFLLVRARKFAALFTCGSLSVACSIAFLVGPSTYCSLMFSRNQLKSTTLYFSSLVATIYSSMVVGSTLLTIPCIIVQVIFLVWMVLKNIPGGNLGLSFLTSFFGSACRTATQSLPV